jgi:pyroglutamyl-peptidase
MTAILITGFGTFPGAPFNPTEALVRRLARTRRPALAGMTIAVHVFPTSYAVVDRELPDLLRRYRPDVLLMFGLAASRPVLCIETRARNALALIPDVGGASPRGGPIAAGGAAAAALPAPARRLLATANTARVPAKLSRDAGRYLCNYLAWRAVEATRQPEGPRLVAFIHVPLVRRFPVPRARVKKRTLTQADLLRAGGALLRAAASARR